MAPGEIGPIMRPAALLLFCGLITAASACTNQPETTPVRENTPSLTLTEAHEKHGPALMALPGVVGSYESRDENGVPCIKVMVVEITDELKREIPDSLEGYRVLIIPTGEIVPRGES